MKNTNQAVSKTVPAVMPVLTVLLVLTLGGYAVAQVCVPPPEGLISWWPGDGNAHDIRGGNDGVLMGGATFAPGMVRQAFSLDGIAGFVDLGNPSNLSRSEQLTVELWIKPNSISLSGFINKHRQNHNSDHSWTLRSAGDIAPAFDDSKVFLGIYGTPAIVNLYINGQPDTNPSTRSLELGKWNHVAATIKSTDGSLIGDNNIPLGIGYLERSVFLDAPRLLFNGLLDEVSIYNRALTSEDIQAIFKAGNAGKCKPCSVEVQRIGQCAGKDARHTIFYSSYGFDASNPTSGHWGAEQYAEHVNSIMCQYGCATTVLSMALAAIGVVEIPERDSLGDPNSEPGIGVTSADPGHLNDYMKSNLSSYTPPGNGQAGNDVVFDDTVDALSSQLQKRYYQRLPGAKQTAIHFNAPSGSPLQGHAPIVGAVTPAHEYLDKRLCEGLPVIVSVTSRAPDPNPDPRCNLGPNGTRRPVVVAPDGTHFVLVTGKSGNDYIIRDPAGVCIDGPELERFGLLSAYGDFVVRGYVVDPPTNGSSLHVSIGEPARVLMIDGQGRRTGIDPTTGESLYEIPNSTFFMNDIADTESGGPSLGITQQVHVNNPAEGQYAVVVSGIGSGTFTLSARAFSQDGSPQLPVRVTKAIAQGSITSLDLGVVTVPGSQSQFVDTMPPTTTAALFPAPNGNGWNKADVRVDLKAADNPGGSGVKRIRYSLSGVQVGEGVAGSSTSITISTEGITTLTYFATDYAGNQETPKTVTVKIDKTPPTVTCGVSPDTLWPPDHKMTTVNASVGVSDAMSGASGFTLAAVTSDEPLGVGDIQGFIVGTPSTAGQLRAERLGGGNGRMYTLSYQGIDAAGNSALCSATVTVPHDRR